MKRFESKDRPPPAGTRSGPRARAAQDRKFGDARARSGGPRAAPSRPDSKWAGPRRADSSRADPYQRADRPTRPDRDAAPGERLSAPTRIAGSTGIVLEADVARVFRDSDAVNEALRMVIRLARMTGGAPRPAFNRSAPSFGPRSAAASPSGPRSRPTAGRFDRDSPRERRPPTSAPRTPKFEESE